MTTPTLSPQNTMFHSFLFLILACRAWVCVLSLVRVFATPQSIALEAPLSMGFSWQEHWSGLPFPPPGILTQGSNPQLLWPLPCWWGLYHWVNLKDGGNIWGPYQTCCPQVLPSFCRLTFILMCRAFCFAVVLHVEFWFFLHKDGFDHCISSRKNGRSYMG